MQLTLHTENDGLNLIRGLSRDGIQINQSTYDQSLLLLPDLILPDWPVRDITELDQELAQPLLQYDADLILLGTGATLSFPPAPFQQTFLSRGLGCEVMDTAAACRTYNVLVSEGRRALAALIL